MPRQLTLLHHAGYEPSALWTRAIRFRKNRRPAQFATAGLALLAGPVFGQQRDWTYAASVYLFAPTSTVGADTPFGPVASELSFSDAISNLELAFLGSFEASNGRWSFLIDYMLNDLAFSTRTPGPAFSGLDTEFRTQVLSGYAAYRVHETQDVQLDIAAGFRWFEMKSTATLSPGRNPGNSATIHEDWVDPVIGARAAYNFSERWGGTAFVDYGGFGDSSET